jgi:carbon storage regulator CsrA
MRTFFQGKGECVVIDGDISVTVLDIDRGEVTLAIDGPESMEAGGRKDLLEDAVEESCPLCSCG